MTETKSKTQRKPSRTKALEKAFIQSTVLPALMKLIDRRVFPIFEDLPKELAELVRKEVSIPCDREDVLRWLRESGVTLDKVTIPVVVDEDQRRLIFSTDHEVSELMRETRNSPPQAGSSLPGHPHETMSPDILVFDRPPTPEELERVSREADALSSSKPVQLGNSRMIGRAIMEDA